MNLVESLKQFWSGADKLISISNKAREEAYIWQTIPDDDTEFLARGMIRIGMVNQAAAWAVRGISNAHTLLRAGLILAPRFVQSVQFYAANGGLWIR